MSTTLHESEPQPDRWGSLPEGDAVERAAASLRENGFKVTILPDEKAALEKLRSIIPAGAGVMTGGSKTLDEIGFTALLSSPESPWVNVKGKIIAEKDPKEQMELRRQAIYADYFVGSVHGVTEHGQLVAGSATGSQLAAYAYGGENLILVVGTQKVTANLDEALQRLREHSVPLEDKRMKGLGAPGTILSKILIYEKERRRNVHVLLVNRKLGF